MSKPSAKNFCRSKGHFDFERWARPKPTARQATNLQRALGNQTPAEFASNGDEEALLRSEPLAIKEKA